MKIGVIIGRFQVPDLTNAHKALIQAVKADSDGVIMFIGQNDIKSSRRYPLSYGSVAKMINDFDSSIVTDVLYDHDSDEHWSEVVDRKILERATPDDEVTLYGGRDSFIPHYKGQFETKEILHLGVESLSGTQTREGVGEPMTEEERRGAIWASQYRWPIAYQVVDAVVLNKDGEVLLCRKEGCKTWGVIGGYVDPEDESLEDAVRREVKEETGLSVNPEYQFSLPIESRRYYKEPDSMMSHVFLCTLADNCFEPKAADDIVEAKWFNRMEMPPIGENHKELLQRIGMGMKERGY